jgi:hypothetical protein
MMIPIDSVINKILLLMATFRNLQYILQHQLHKFQAGLTKTIL